MRVAHRLADVLSSPAPPPPGGFINSLPEAFGAVDEHGEVFVIGYKGEWFHRVKPSLRVRLHNWLVRVGSSDTADR
jgi:hypothetical protein